MSYVKSNLCTLVKLCVILLIFLRQIDILSDNLGPHESAQEKVNILISAMKRIKYAGHAASLAANLRGTGLVQLQSENNPYVYLSTALYNAVDDRRNFKRERRANSMRRILGPVCM